MQGNRDGSWSVNNGSGRGNVVPVPGGYLPPLFSNFNLQQPIHNYPANFYRPNFQSHQNLIFNYPQILHQFAYASNVFLQPHNQSFSLPPPPKPEDISTSQHRDDQAFESSSLKRRRQEKASDGKGSLEKKSSEVARIDKAVNTMRQTLIAAGESVSSTRVSQSVLEQLEADDSWRFLGLQMTDVHSLRQLIALEGKINAFIHCYVGARRIVTLYDLEVAICRNEFIDSFDDLELGPLLQHPLVLLYFPSISSCTSSNGVPVQITTEEIISFLDSYIYTYHNTDDVKLDEFLNFVADKKSVSSKEQLGVRIQSLRMHVSFILEAKRQEGETLKVLLTDLHQKYQIPSSKKQKQAKSLSVSDSFALHQKKHIRFDSSSSDENDSVDFGVENLNCVGKSLQANQPNTLHSMEMKSGSSSSRNQPTTFHLHSNTLLAAQAVQTGKLGEKIAYKHYVSICGKESLVRWVNEHSETGLPYDLMIENRNGKKEYIEVKATVSTRKDFFYLTVNEWQFANEIGDGYMIAHVLLGNSEAILTQYRNPVKLCQEGHHLRLLIHMLKQQNQVIVAF